MGDERREMFELKDILTLIISIMCFGTGLVMMIFGARNQSHASTQEASENSERLVRIEDQTKTTSTEVIKINMKLDEQVKANHELDKRVSILEQSVNKAHSRLDTRSDRLDEIERAHYSNCGREITD